MTEACLVTLRQCIGTEVPQPKRERYNASDVKYLDCLEGLLSTNIQFITFPQFKSSAMPTYEIYSTAAVSVETLRFVLAANIVSTTIHYPHNYRKAEQYPPIWLLFPTPLSYRISVVIFWPLLSVLGYFGYQRYKSGTIHGIRDSIVLLTGYSFLGTTSIGYFLGGVP